MAGIVTEADYVFIPEWPPETNWPEQLCRKLVASREIGNRLNIIIVAEGAIDREGNKITCEQVKKVVVDNTQQDTRITILGHVQRGGAPSAFDRILGCRMGAESVLALMDATPETEACVVSLAGNTAVRVPLMECVKKTQAVAQAMAEKNWNLAVELRGRSFKRNLETYFMLSKYRAKVAPGAGEISGGAVHNVGVLTVGAPCCGMNAAVRSFVRNTLTTGNRPFAIHNGIEGLINGKLAEMTWGQCSGWSVQGGALLGTKRTLPEGHYEEIAATIR